MPSGGKLAQRSLERAAPDSRPTTAPVPSSAIPTSAAAITTAAQPEAPNRWQHRHQGAGSEEAEAGRAALHAEPTVSCGSTPAASGATASRCSVAKHRTGVLSCLGQPPRQPPVVQHRRTNRDQLRPHLRPHYLRPHLRPQPKTPAPALRRGRRLAWSGWRWRRDLNPRRVAPHALSSSAAAGSDPFGWVWSRLSRGSATRCGRP
jgi:hypothetical protein